MDGDGYSTQGRRGKGRNKEPTRDRDLASFQREVERYAGTPQQFNEAHARHHGAEEGCGPDGSHPNGYRFPRGSVREHEWKEYSVNKEARDRARDGYDDGYHKAQNELDKMPEQQQNHYISTTGGLPPDQHERLGPRAKALKDLSYNSASKREAFLKAHPYGYHSAAKQQDHYDFVETAYGEYEHARDRQQHHERHQSQSKVDKRVDQWGRPMSSHR